MQSKKLTVILLAAFLLSLAPSALAKEAKAEFKVWGMSCGACAKGVEARLADLPGVKSAIVSYEDSSATVNYDDEKVTAAKIKKTIEQSGFKAEPKGKGKK